MRRELRRARRPTRSPAALGGLLAACLLAAGCTGSLSRKPPIHLVQNMDQQEKFQAQEPNEFFPDGRAMRPRIEGTVPRGSLGGDEHLDQGRVDGEWARSLPPQIPLDRDLLRRGRERYGIYCAPCHDLAGTGKGPVVERGFLPPPSFHDARLRAVPLGQLYDIVANGVRNMPAYGSQVPVADRWAIATYVRALQVARNVRLEDVPAAIRAEEGWQ